MRIARVWLRIAGWCSWHGGRSGRSNGETSVAAWCRSWEHVGHAILAGELLDWADGARGVGREWAGLQHAAGVEVVFRGGRAVGHVSAAGSPDILEVAWRDILTIFSGNARPEASTAGLVDGTEAVSVDASALLDGSVDAETHERLRGVLRGQRAWLREQQLVRIAVRRVIMAEGRSRAVAHGGGLAGVVGAAEVTSFAQAVLRRIRRLVGGAGGASRSGRQRTLAAVATVRKLVVVKPASQLSLIQVSGDVLVRHLLPTGLEEVVFLNTGLVIVLLTRLPGHARKPWFSGLVHTSSSDQDRLPPVEVILR